MRFLDSAGLSYLVSKLKATFAPISHTHTKTQITDFPTSMPADGGHADSATTADSATNATNATNAVNATNAQNATNAESATKATNDSAGQKIDSTYIKSIQVTGTQGTFTRGDNSTGNFTTQDTTYEVVSETADGLAPKLPGDETKFLRGDGTWQVPPQQSGGTGGHTIVDGEGTDLPQRDKLKFAGVPVSDNSTGGSTDVDFMNFLRVEDEPASPDPIDPIPINADTLNGKTPQNIVDEAVSDSLAQMKNYIPNPNLGTNTNFKYPVNQRGKTSYSVSAPSTDEISIDRWRISVGTDYNVSSRTISGQSYNSRTCGMWQSNEFEKHGLQIGDVISISVFANNELHICTSQILDRSQYESFVSVPNAYENEDFEVVVCSDIIQNCYKVGIYPKKSIVVDYIKWEKGTLATPWFPKAYSEELLECQRYYYRLGAGWQPVSKITGWGSVVTIDVPIGMRATPTMIIGGENGLRIFTPTGWVPATFNYFANFVVDKARINVVIEPSQNIDEYNGNVLICEGIEALSADL